MRTIIAGSRSLDCAEAVDDAMTGCGWVPSLVVCGCAIGVDIVGWLWARKRKIPVEYFPGWPKQRQWALKVAERYGELVHECPTTGGKGAGYIRNRRMAKNAAALVAVWDGLSRGTENMINEAKKHQLQVYVWQPVTLPPPSE